MFPIVFVLAVLMPLTEGLPGGPPLGACQSMTPQHGAAQPQTSAAPYTITMNSTSYDPGSVIQGKLNEKYESN